MNTSKHRHDGGACRRCKTMIAAHAKPRKDRSGGNVSFLVDFDLHRWREMETRYE